MNKQQLFLLLLLTTFAVANLKIVHAERTAHTLTFYYQNKSYSVNGQIGYLMNNTSPTGTIKTFSGEAAGNVNVSWSVRVFIVQSNNKTVELTSTYSAMVTRTTAGVSLQTATWTLHNNVYLEIGYSVLMVTVYMRFANGAWTSLTTFLTEPMSYYQLTNATWTFIYYTSRGYVEGYTQGSFSFGSATAKSRVENVKTLDSYKHEWMLYLIGKGDLVQSIVYPFIIGGFNIFYPFLMLIITSTTYFKFRQTMPIIILIVLLGGGMAGGIWNLLVGDLPLAIVYPVVALALAGLLYATFR